MRFTDRIALVTGAGAGIGRGCARRLAAEGATVIVADVNAETGARVAAELGGASCYLPVDVSAPERVTALFQEVERRFGGLDVLVNNAGITYRWHPLEASLEQWDEAMNTNLRSVWLCSRAAVPLMQARGGGAIVNIASTHAWRTMPHTFPYGVSKGGVISLTVGMALDFGPLGIRINAIAPGRIHTRPGGPYDHMDDPAEAERQTLAIHPLGRIGAPDDVAGAVAFLASDDAGFVTGHVLTVDGGRGLLTQRPR